MLLPKPVIHGVYALCYLSRQPRHAIVPAKEVAAKMEVPPEQASKILQALASAGYLAAHRGRQGGYALRRDLREITLADVFGAINESNGQERLRPRPCPEAPVETCTAHGGLMRLHERFWDIMRAETLASLLGAACCTKDAGGALTGPSDENPSAPPIEP